MVEIVQTYIPESNTGIEPLLNINITNNNLFLTEAKGTNVNKYGRYIFTNSQDDIYVSYCNTVSKVEQYMGYNTFALADVSITLYNKVFIYEKMELSYKDIDSINYMLSNLNDLFPKMTNLSLQRLKEDLTTFINRCPTISVLPINILTIASITDMKKKIVNINGLAFSTNRNKLLKYTLGKANINFANRIEATYYVLNKKKGDIKVPIANTEIVVRNTRPANINTIVLEASSGIDSVTDIIDYEDSSSDSSVDEILNIFKKNNLEEILKQKQIDKKILTNLILKLETNKISAQDKDIKNILDILKIVNMFI